MAAVTDDAALIVVGAGIQGLAIATAAAEAGRRVLLIERDRPGQATSAAWFRILHGGLRYLQSLDVPRLRASMVERRRFLRLAPDQIAPLAFLMPLYGQGLKRPEVFRLAFLADRALTFDRNRGVPARLHLAPGRVIGPGEVGVLYPGVRRDGLTGGALWQEAVVPDGQALFGALLARAEAAGVEVRGRLEAEALILARGRVAGLRAREATGGGVVEVAAPVVVNAAGPWTGALARRLDPAAPTLFHPVLGFNLLIDRPPPAALGLSLTPPGRAGPMLFLYPHGGRVFAGTWYAPWHGAPGAPGSVLPAEPDVEAFLAALNAAAPGLEASRADVVEITAGLLPGAAPASAAAAVPGALALSDRDLIHDHGRAGGPPGLFSVVGVKYTTAGRVAGRLLVAARLGRAAGC